MGNDIANCTFNSSIGTVLTKNTTNEAKECKIQCENILLCSHFIWDPKTGNQCILKSGTVSPVDVVKSTSGVNCGIVLLKVYNFPQSQQIIDTRLDGEVVDLSFNASSIEDCVKNCVSKINSCQSLSFYKPGKICLFYKEESPGQIECSEKDYTSVTFIRKGRKLTKKKFVKNTPSLLNFLNRTTDDFSKNSR